MTKKLPPANSLVKILYERFIREKKPTALSAMCCIGLLLCTILPAHASNPPSKLKSGKQQTAIGPVMEAPPSCFINLGLDSWSVEGDPSHGNWIPATDGSSVRQTVNSDPSFYVSNADYFNTTIQGEFMVQTTDDDDFIGFVLGYQSPNSGTSNDEYNFILFDWKQAAQICANQEMRLTRVQGTATDVMSVFWCQDNAINDVLARSTALGGWADNTAYTFQVEYGATNISVWVNGTQVFDVDGTFESGRFGFYNYSQPTTLYRNFSLPFSAVINKTDESCTGANDGAATAVVSDFATGPYSYLWNTGETTETITNLAPGTYDVTVTSQDGCTANASVTIGTAPDTTAPVAVCQDITVQLDALGNASITAAEIDNGSTDNCGIASTAIDINSFNCNNIGANAVVLTVTDNSGNTSTCTATVTVEDNITPVARAKNLTLQLNDPTGLTLNPAMVDNGSSDNCSFTLSLSKTNFSCTDIGTQNVILTVTDTAGNTATASSEITILAPDPFVVTSPGVTEITTPTVLSTIDNALSINYNDPVNGALVFIDSNFQVGDELALDSGYTLPSGVTSSYNATSGILTISGTLTPAQIETLFQNVQFRTSSSNSVDRTIQFTMGSSIANPENDHFYEYINGNFTWTQAKADAATRSLYGLQGYLATATSATENDFIKNNLINDGWLGGSDDFNQINTAVGSTLFANQGEAEGKWYWITGPEAGTQFSNGATPVGGEYANWNSGEPNNSSGSEHFLQIYFANNGRWNDLGSSQNLGYIVEYGGMPGDAQCFSFSGNKVVQLNQAPELSPIANDTGCPGQPYSTTLVVTDNEDALADLSFSATSNDQTVVQDSNATVTFDGTDYTLELTPETSIQGTATITVTVTDTGGQSDVETFDYTTEDTENPVANCVAPFTVQLDATGNAAITAADIDNGSTDNCGIASTTIDVSSFDCSNVGDNTVTLTVTDVNGNSSTCTTVVTVEDTVVPIANCAAPFTVQLDATGNAAITAADIDNGSTDNCGIASTTIDVSSFDCSNVGDNTVTLTVTDVNGNSSTCTTVVTVEDTVAPIANCVAPFTVQLDSNGEASITAADIDNGSTDNCGIASTTLDVSSFDCSNVGDNTVTLTVTDVNGNSSTCTTVVTVEDTVAPIANCAAPFTVQLDSNGEASITAADIDNGSTDNCGIASTTLDVSSFDCSNVGDNTVTLTVTDVNGNSSTCTTTVTVEDTVAPTLYCNVDLTADTDFGECYATVYFPDALATDNCSGVTVVQTAGLPSGSQFPVGVSTVEFTATDASGNSSVCTFDITVEDNEAPIAVCENITVQLDEFGSASITAADLDGGSTDACGVDTIAINQDTFDCSNVGDNNVTLTVTDVNGNVSSCTAVVTVEDITAPEVVCQDITVQLDATGTVSITGMDVDGGSTDACGIASYDLDIDTFNCSNVGVNAVALTVTDNNGNTATCTAMVTVEDTIAPDLVCTDFTLELGQDGTATLLPDDVIASLDEACGIETTAVDITEFDCSDIGTPVTVQ
ncbi:HYR domain-containing protein, partial [Marixanthomonas spongiae]